MSEDATYEYAEVIVGFFGKGQGTPGLPFMQVRDLAGETTTPNFTEGPLGALNLMGAQGWKLLSEREASSGRMNWIWAELKRHDDAINPEQHQGTEFLMMRQVRE